MSNTDRVLGYLASIAPRPATNADIVARTDIRPHQQVFQITKYLADKGKIASRQYGTVWEFWFVGPSAPPVINGTDIGAPSGSPSSSPPRRFETAARAAMQAHYGQPFREGEIEGIPKRWDLLSADRQIVGDAKYYTMVGGERFPPAKMSVIAEHVWLLERTPAHEKFLVFGNDRRVPEVWLQRFGHLVKDVRFWFLEENGALDLLSRREGM